ncbi:unnamed protein product, partial [Mycena citricolor]
ITPRARSCRQRAHSISRRSSSGRSRYARRTGPRLIASRMPKLMPCPPTGLWMCAASPTRRTTPPPGSRANARSAMAERVL